VIPDGAGVGLGIVQTVLVTLTVLYLVGGLR
jgi:hypothetical protein